MKRMTLVRTNNQTGSFLVAAVVMILFLTAIGISIAGVISSQYQHAKLQVFAQNADLVAEAGIEQSVHQLNSDDSFAGFSSPQQLFDNATQGKGTFTSTITTNSDGKSKTIISTGNVYRSASSTPYLTRKVKVVVVGTTSNGYSVSTGPGGLILSGSSSITNSDVYVNGSITLSGTSSIGTKQNPVNVNVANISCPRGSSPGATYPTLCTDGTQPISLASSSHIYGSVCATGQTSAGPAGNNIQGGNGGQGLEAGCTAPTVSQPVYDRAGIISGITTTASGTSGTYACGGNNSITLPANIELTGNVNWGHSCKVTISGNVYIPGNLTINGAAKISVSDSVGTTRPIVVADGTISVGGSSSMAANTSGTGIDFVSFKNSTGDPAATPTGTNLYNSQQQQNVIVNGSVNLAGMIFDAYWSEVNLGGSGNVGAAAGQTVEISGSGTVIFGTALSSGSKTWTITSYQPLYN